MSSATENVEEILTPQAKKPAGRRRLFIIAATAALVLAAAAAGLWFSGILSTRHTDSSRNHSADIAEKPTLIDIPDVVTNLDNGTHRAVFVKVKAKIEIAHVRDQAVVNANMPRILDAFQTYIRSLRPEELHGGEGTYRLKEALINRISIIASPVSVTDILFMEILVQ